MSDLFSEQIYSSLSGATKPPRSTFAVVRNRSLRRACAVHRLKGWRLETGEERILRRRASCFVSIPVAGGVCDNLCLRSCRLVRLGARVASLAGPFVGSSEFSGVAFALCPGAFLFLHQLKRDYPLNLSISLSGGEETNQDAPSNGE